MDVAGPAVPQFIAAVVLAQHGIGPLPQLGELGAEGLLVQADPVGRDGTRRRAAKPGPSLRGGHRPGHGTLITAHAPDHGRVAVLTSGSAVGHVAVCYRYPHGALSACRLR